MDDQTLTIEVSLGDLVLRRGEEGEETFGQYVADRAAELLLAREGRDPRDDLRRRVSALADERIKVTLAPLIEEAITGLVTPTDGFGQPKGPNKTLREVIVEAARLQLRARSDDRSSFAKSETLLAKVIREEVERALNTELREAVKEAKEEVLAAVRAKAADVIADTIARVAEGRPVG